MNKVSKAILSLLFLGLLSTRINAQTSAPASGSKPGIRLGAGLGILTPFGKTYDRYDGGYGVNVQADFPLVSDKLYLTAASGYETLYAVEDERDVPIVPDVKRIPVKAGLKFFPVNNLYVQADAGVSVLTNKGPFNDGKFASFMYSPKIGYWLQLGGRSNLDISARYEQTTRTFSSGSSLNYLGFNLLYAYRF